MSRQVKNLDLNQIEWFRTAMRCDPDTALRRLQLYGFLEYKVSEGDLFKQNTYRKKTGCSRNTVKTDLALMRSLGWIDYEWQLGDPGTTVEIFGIPFDQDPEEIAAQLVSKGCSATEQGGCSTSEQGGCSTSEQGDALPVSKGCSTSEQGDAQPVSISNKDCNKNNKNESKKRPSLSEELVSRWNELKPNSWTKLQGLSPSRERSIKALGGYQAFMDLLPAAMAAAKASSFWGKKKISFENFIGTGTTPKGHIHSLAEEGAELLKVSSAGKLKPASHPDFFPPNPLSGSMHPKHNRFADSADRQAREQQAREFYSTQS